MIIFVIVLVLVIVFIAADYGLYRFVFAHPVRKRPDAHNIPDSRLYSKYKDIMSEVVDDMEKIPHEEVSVVSSDGYRLYGRLYEMKKEAPVIVFLHGYHGLSEWDGFGFFRICKNNRINILMADERAHGKSEGNIITLGIKERHDCKLWTDYVVERYGNDKDVFLAGVSMGASSVLMSTALTLPGNVKGIISDCGFSEPASMIKETIRQMKLPVEPMYFFVNLGAKMFGHFNLEEITSLKAVKNLKLPVLFIHGKEDSVVPLSMNEELFDNCTGIKQRVLIDGADHANSAMTDYQAYEKAVMEFIHGICNN